MERCIPVGNSNPTAIHMPLLCIQLFYVLILIWLQILPDMIGRSSRLFHNRETGVKAYVDLEAFRRADSYDMVSNLSKFTHELRWVKSSAELKLMRESASIACQVLQSLQCS